MMVTMPCRSLLMSPDSRLAMLKAEAMKRPEMNINKKGSITAVSQGFILSNVARVGIVPA